MTQLTSAATASAAPIVVSDVSAVHKASALIRAAETLLKTLSVGHTLDAHLIREAMDSAFGASDATGAWMWKDAYDAIEAAQVLFLRRYLPAMRKRIKSQAQLLDMIAKVASLVPTHTRRSEESAGLQQFSTPMELALIVAEAAAITPADMVLEPSAGTGQLAIHADVAGASLTLNELATTRADLLATLFCTPVAGFNAEHIHDRLPDGFAPSVVIMNPPFSAAPHVRGTFNGVDMRHVRSALARLAPGGRLVAITSRGFSPDNPAYADAFAAIAETATVQFTCPLDGRLFRRHGTTIETRLTVIDKQPAPQNHKPACMPLTGTVAALRVLLETHLPARLPCTPAPGPAPTSAPNPALHFSPERAASVPKAASAAIVAVELAYEAVDVAQTAASGESLYEPYAPERVRIDGAKPHPTKLVQSAAMASVLPPLPHYRPHLPPAVVSEGLLSDAQLESVVYAGEAHSRHLSGLWQVGDSFDSLNAAAEGADSAVQFRRGWFLGDGTGAGKGRQVAGIILDNWIKGRRRAVWISKSDKLLEDAQRDWSALGQEKLLIVAQDRFRQGKPITLNEGILFTTYATLRSAEREGKASRLQQILNWVGPSFDGVIVFDEAHAMGNAGGSSSERGIRAASQQGVAGLKLQHALPDARVVYVSATGATTVENLAYAQRLGLWGSDDLPFETRAAFVAAMHQGGIASSEVLARDLKALGLYMARSLSYDGVTVDMLEHDLTPAQIGIYDAYAAAYQIIHKNLDDAMKAANITSEGGAAYNRNAKSAARSAFESNKQRFFGHLITAMKVPTLLTAIRQDLVAGRAAVIQLVSTSEALMERRLAQIPPFEWGDLSFDVTPREYVLDYLTHSFPTQLYETYTDDKDVIQSRPVYHDGQPVLCRDAIARRDALIESLAALPPVQSALDQIIHQFGTDAVAEVTGRSRRIVRKKSGSGFKLSVEQRPASSNIAETQAFMDDVKRILIFSDAGGTGRSYHADLACLNQRPRIHYLLEAGWKADAAIQGLGRSNRTNQAQPPVFRPVASDVRGEKRFLSTIARRLDSLGAITRGQRQTGGQGLFRASDNLESQYARDALRHFYRLIHAGHVPCATLQEFEDATGLSLCDGDGTLREDLPLISTFLNRILALPIALQNQLFAIFEGLIEARVEAAIAAGTYEMGLETIRAESLIIGGRTTVAISPTGSHTELVEIIRKDRNTPLTLDAILSRSAEPGAVLLANARSSRAALQLPTSSLTLEDGTIETRVRLIRPMEHHAIPTHAMQDTHWEPCDVETFKRLWLREMADIPEFSNTRFHLMTGLLLPIWKSLPFDNPRIYRLSTDDGQTLIGRLIPDHHVDVFKVPTATRMTAEEAWHRILHGADVLLDGSATLKRVMVMHQPRIELTGFDHTDLPRLKAMGLFSEIIAWKLRLFVPMGEDGPPVVGKLLSKYALLSHAA